MAAIGARTQENSKLSAAPTINITVPHVSFSVSNDTHRAAAKVPKNGASAIAEVLREESGK